MKHVPRLAILATCSISLACAASDPPRPADMASAGQAPGPEAAAHAEHVQPHELPAIDGPGYTAADVRFMQGMIGHHAQALVMTAMIPTHGAGEEVRRMGEKIEISQRDEIEFMKRWLAERDQVVPPDDAMHHMHMPGMLTPDQLERLDAARGHEFDRLFLAFMIQHHQGALTMVDALFASPGAAQDPEIFRFVTDVDVDQRAEIYTMQSVLDMLGTTSGSPSR